MRKSADTDVDLEAMWLVEIKGQIKGGNLPASASDAILESIAKDLEAQGIKSVRRQNTLRFENDAGMQWSFFRYVGVGSGIFEVVRRGPDILVVYRLSTMRLFIIAVGLLVFISLVAMANRIAWPTIAIVVAASFVWLFGMNYLLVWARTIPFLRRTVRAARNGV